MFLYRHILVLLTLSLPFLASCAKITKAISSPTYSVHSGEQILFDNNKVENIFVYEAVNDKYNIHKNIIKDIKAKLATYGIKTVDNVNDADHTLSINIRNISVGVDSNFAESMRNTITSKEINYSYNFDTNNSPHINNSETTFKEKQSYTYKRFLPSTLYTLLGSGIGFTIGFTLAGSLSPFAFGILGGTVLGGATYLTYNTFRKVGVIISYDVIIGTKNSKTLKHNRKLLTKSSSNSSDEIFYSYNNNWQTMISKNIVIAIGSKVLTKDMIVNICPIIADNTIKIVNYK